LAAEKGPAHQGPAINPVNNRRRLPSRRRRLETPRAILLRSATRTQPEGLGQLSGLYLGRNYMVHNQHFIRGRQSNPAEHHSVGPEDPLGMNDFYEARLREDNAIFASAILQCSANCRRECSSRPTGGQPNWAAAGSWSARSVDIYLTTEGPAVDGEKTGVCGSRDRILIDWTTDRTVARTTSSCAGSGGGDRAERLFVGTRDLHAAWGSRTNSHSVGGRPWAATIKPAWLDRPGRSTTSEKNLWTGPGNGLLLPVVRPPAEPGH